MGCHNGKSPCNSVTFAHYVALNTHNEMSSNTTFSDRYISHQNRSIDLEDLIVADEISQFSFGSNHVHS